MAADRPPIRPPAGPGARGRAAAEGAGPGRARQPAGVRGPDRRGPGHGQRRGGRARPPGRPRRRPDRGRRRGHRGRAPAWCTTCSTSRPAWSPPPTTPRAGPPWSDLVPDRAPGVPGRPARPRHRGPAAAHQRRRADPPPDPSVVRRGQGVPGPRRRAADPRRSCAGCARASSSRTASPRRPRWRRSPDGLLRHRDPRGPQPPGAAHVRGRRPPGARGWCAPASARWPTASCSPGAGGAHRGRGPGARARPRWRLEARAAGRAADRAGVGPGHAGSIRRHAHPPSVPCAAPPPSTTTPPSRSRERTATLLARDARPQRHPPRRPHQRHLHRHRRHPLDVPGPGRPRARAGRRAAASAPGSSTSRGPPRVASVSSCT